MYVLRLLVKLYRLVGLGATSTLTEVQNKRWSLQSFLFKIITISAAKLFSDRSMRSCNPDVKLLKRFMSFRLW
jgi:hypothetical protein